MKTTPKKPSTAPRKPPRKAWSKPKVRTGLATEKNALGPSNPCGTGIDEENGCPFGP